MSHKHHGNHHPYCLNCHYPLSEFDKNCSQCGQKPTDGKTTMHDLLHEFIHMMFHLDGKFFWTLKHLFIPGKLTLEFFKGHHKRYAHPIQLFLVIGALAFGTIVSKTHKAEEQIQKRVEKEKSKVLRQQFLLELDSVSSKVSSRIQGTQGLHDSLMLGMLYPLGLKADEKEVKLELNKIIDKEIKKAETNPIYSFKIEGDSSEIQEFKDSLIDALLTNKPIAKIDIKREEFKSSGNPVKDFTVGMSDGMQESFIDNLKEKLEPQLALLRKNVNVKEALQVKEDSINILGLFFNSSDNKNHKEIKIPKREVYELTPDSIIEKYHITDFKDKIMAKQYVKTVSGGGSYFHFYMSKLFWATFAIIPVLAGFFMLMYRRQKRYYVEHIVFLMHYNTSIFLGLIATLYIFPYWNGISGLFTLWVAIHFFLAIKNYYQQGWRKTFLKYMIINTVYLSIAMIFMILTGLIGFLLF